MIIYETNIILNDKIFERYNRSLSVFIRDNNKDEEGTKELLLRKIEKEEEVYDLKDVRNDYMNDSIKDNNNHSTNDYLKGTTTDSTKFHIYDNIKCTLQYDKNDSTKNVIYDSTNTTVIEDSNGKKNNDEGDYSLCNKKKKKRRK